MSIKATIVRKIGDCTLWFARHKAEIFTGLGIVTGLAGTVTACVATTKASVVVDSAKEQIDDIHSKHELNPEEYPDEQMTKDLTSVYIHTGAEIAKLYAIPVALEATSIGCTIGGHSTLRKENLALAGGYAVLSEKYKQLQERMKNDLGEDKTDELVHGYVKGSEIERVDENGNVVHETNYYKVGEDLSQYARVFDNSNINWQGDICHSYTFLKQILNFAQDKLQRTGHLFLNDVLEALGFDKIPEGQFVGWIYEPGKKIDFGLKRFDIDEAMDMYREGESVFILLDFNVDGDIMHFFKKNKDEGEKE